MQSVCRSRHEEIVALSDEFTELFCCLFVAVLEQDSLYGWCMRSEIK